MPAGEAEGHVVAHRHPLRGRTLAKGSTLGAEDVEALIASGVDVITVVELDDGDVSEDQAAERITAAAAGGGLRVGEVGRGRGELVATDAGLIQIDEERVVRLNDLDDALTLSTLRTGDPVRAGDRVAVAKVIPLAVAEPIVARGCALLSEDGGAVSVTPFRPARVGMVMTTLPHSREPVVEKVIQSVRGRLTALGSTLDEVRRCPHDVAALATAIEELGLAGFSLILVHGASSAMDRDDVLPMGVVAGGAELIRIGIPVEPGNQMLLARRGEGGHVLSVPACASSRNRTAFDTVLERVLAGLPVDRKALGRLAVGGLLLGRAKASVRIVDRPEPSRVAAVVLAAGRSVRMGDEDKLALEVGGAPMVRRVVETALAAGLEPVVVVTGPDSRSVRSIVGGQGDRRIEWVSNPDASEGMGTSVSAGITAVRGRGIAAAAILLGDMPLVTAETLRALMGAYEPGAGVTVCVPVIGARRGNPVLWGAGRFDDLCALSGDEGARGLLRRLEDEAREVAVADPGILMDIDDAAALADARRRIADES